MQGYVDGLPTGGVKPPPEAERREPDANENPYGARRLARQLRDCRAALYTLVQQVNVHVRGQKTPTMSAELHNAYRAAERELVRPAPLPDVLRQTTPLPPVVLPPEPAAPPSPQTPQLTGVLVRACLERAEQLSVELRLLEIELETLEPEHDKAMQAYVDQPSQATHYAWVLVRDRHDSCQRNYRQTRDDIAHYRACAAGLEGRFHP